MADTTIVTDDSGTEYVVDTADLNKMNLEQKIEDSSRHIVNVSSHINDGRDWDLLVEIARSGRDTQHIFGRGSDAADVLEEFGYEPELLFFEMYDSGIYGKKSWRAVRDSRKAVDGNRHLFTYACRWGRYAS